MIIKKLVTITVFSSLTVMGLLLLAGLFVPKSFLEKMSGGQKSKNTTSVVAVDASGNVIKGATVEVAADGSTKVVDASGNAVAGASATASTPAASGSSAVATPVTPSGSTAVKTTSTTPPPVASAPATSISSFGASPASIAFNASSTLSWASASATSCTISPTIGSVATSGSRSTGSLTASTTFTLSCSGNGSASKTAGVTVAAAPPSCGSPGGACTAAQVAVHNSAGNCWVMYSGSYYIITSYVTQHNGGSGAFTSSTCGHDITAYMNGSSNAGTSVAKHNHTASAYNKLATYKVGAVN